MRIVRYETQDAGAAFGCVSGGDVYRLDGDPLDDPRRGERVGALGDVRLLAPCKPGKVVAMEINFDGIDGYSPDMSEPMVFIKPGTSVCAPGDDVVNPWPDLPWWGEAELGVVL